MEREEDGKSRSAGERKPYRESSNDRDQLVVG